MLMAGDGGDDVDAIIAGIHDVGEEATVEQVVSQDGADRRMEEKENRCNMVVKEWIGASMIYLG